MNNTQKKFTYFLVTLLFSTTAHAGFWKDYVTPTKNFVSNTVHKHPQLTATCAAATAIAAVALYKLIQYKNEISFIEQRCSPLAAELSRVQELAAQKRIELGRNWSVTIDKEAVYKNILPADGAEYKKLTELSDKQVIGGTIGISSAVAALITFFTTISDMCHRSTNPLSISQELPRTTCCIHNHWHHNY